MAGPLTDINTPTSATPVAPLAVVAGTAGSKVGTAAETPEDTGGALAAALDPFYAYRQSARRRQEAAIKDVYAEQEKALREQRLGMTKGERFVEALTAFGQPVVGGTGVALANAAKAMAERSQAEREAERARQDRLAELSLQQKLKLAEQGAKYEGDELDYLAKLSKGSGRDLKLAGLATIAGRSVPIVVDMNTNEFFQATPGGNLTPAAAPAGAPAKAAGAPAGAPAAAPAGAPAEGGAAWQKHIGETVAGADIGLSPDAVYFVTEAGPGEPIKGGKTLSGDAAIKASGGAYDRGTMVAGEFKPFNEKDRLPTLDEYQANLSAVRQGITTEQAKLQQIKSLAAKITPLTTGAAGAVMQFVPGSAAFTLRGDLQTAVGAIAMDKLRELKQQSATGASGLGAVSERELALLETSIASLNQAKNAVDLKKATDEVAKHYQGALRAMQADGQRVMGQYQRVRNVLAPEAKPEAKVKVYNLKTGGFD